MGFGFVNNVAVGAMHGTYPSVHVCALVYLSLNYTSAYLNHGIRRIVIFDYDLHHGKHHFYVTI